MLFSQQLESYFKDRKDSLRTPKISLSVITGVLSVVWLFPQTVAEHPVLKNIINFENQFFLIGWLTFLFYTAAFWVIISRKENREKQLLKFLKTERAQNKILLNFSEIKQGTQTFSKEDLIEFIIDEYGIRRNHPSVLSLFMGRSGIDQETAESLANLILDKSTLKGLIKKNNQTISISDNYDWLINLPNTVYSK